MDSELAERADRLLEAVLFVAGRMELARRRPWRERIRRHDIELLMARARHEADVVPQGDGMNRWSVKGGIS